MNSKGQESALARLHARRKQIERELARVERQTARAVRQVIAAEERIASLERSRRPAA